MVGSKIFPYKLFFDEKRLFDPGFLVFSSSPRMIEVWFCRFPGRR